MTILHSLLFVSFTLAAIMFLMTKLARFDTGFAVECAVKSALGFLTGIAVVILFLTVGMMHVTTVITH